MPAIHSTNCLNFYFPAFSNPLMVTIIPFMAAVYMGSGNSGTGVLDAKQASKHLNKWTLNFEYMEFIKSIPPWPHHSTFKLETRCDVVKAWARERIHYKNVLKKTKQLVSNSDYFDNLVSHCQCCEVTHLSRDKGDSPGPCEWKLPSLSGWCWGLLAPAPRPSSLLWSKDCDSASVTVTSVLPLGMTNLTTILSGLSHLGISIYCVMGTISSVYKIS